MTRRGGDRPGADLRPHTLYRLFGDGDRLLYVGVTCQIDIRLYQHRRYSNWWPLVRRDAWSVFDDRASALAAEVVAIAEEGPLFNVVHAAPPLIPLNDEGGGRAALYRYLRDELQVSFAQARQVAYSERPDRLT